MIIHLLGVIGFVMKSFRQRFLSVIKTDGLPVFAKVGIITMIGGYLFDIAPLTMVIIAIIGFAFLMTQKTLRFISNRELIEMFYYISIIWGIVITAWLGYIAIEGFSGYFTSALLAYLLYKTFDCYKGYSAYKSIENNLLLNVLEQAETNKTISIHAAYQKSLLSKDEIIETISNFQQIGKLPLTLQIIE